MGEKGLKDKIYGSLVGGAVGDALGYPVEFMSAHQILAKYGPNGITRYKLSESGVAEISDDTQMSLYTANGLLIGDIKAAYLEWYKTQTQHVGAQQGAKCWISQAEEMYSLRAPGTTCMSALQAIMSGQNPHNDSKGCGGIMRVAPIALWGYANSRALEEVVEKGCHAAYLTHQHPLGFLSAGLLVALLYQILAAEETPSADTLFDYVLYGITILSSLKTDDGISYKDLYYDDLVALRAGSSDAALKARQTGDDDIRNIESIGQGWTGEEAWYISLYCVLKHIDNFEDAVVAAVNHGGDSDSTGAITGNIMGAIIGYDAIPDHYKENLELRDVIEIMAEDLYNGKLSK